MKPIAPQLKKARKLMKMSQREFAKYLGINFTSYLAIEQGKYRNPSGKNFSLIADKITLK